MSKTVRLSESETVELITAATAPNVLCMTFGPGGVFLDLEKSPAPILRRLAELRGISKSGEKS